MSTSDDAPTGTNRRKAMTLSEIRKKLTKFGMSLFGRKPAQNSKLEKCEQISELVNNKPIDGSWNLDEFEAIISLLPEENEEWDANDVKYTYKNLNQRTCAYDVLTETNLAAIERIKQAYHEMFDILPRKKTDTVTADSLLDMMDKLAKKRPAKWGKKESDLIIARFSMVHAIDAAHSSCQAIEKYMYFVGQLGEYYAQHPEMKARIDPEVVSFDLSAVNLADYTNAIAAYSAVPGAGGVAVHPAHLGPFPEAWNPGAVPVLFPMPNPAAANHFIGYMRATVANLRAVLIPAVTSAALVY